MERRFVILIVSLALVWTSWIALQLVFPPKRPVAKQQGGENVPAQADGKGAPAPNAAQIDKKPADAAVAAVPGDAKPAAEAAAPVVPAVPLEYVALGSLDPSSPDKMLVTLTNRGAAVERVELNSPRYKSVEDQSGYLSHLALADRKRGGAEIRVVGAGTPAAVAKANAPVAPGLVIGDVIQFIDGQPMEVAQDVIDYLKTKTRPDQTIKLLVERAGNKEPIEFTAKLVRRPLEVVQPEHQETRLPNGDKRISPIADPPSLLMAIESIGGRPLKAADDLVAGATSLTSATWKIENRGPDFVEFILALDDASLAKIEQKGRLKIVKRYSLAKAEKPGDPGNHLNLQISIRNEGDEPQRVAYHLDGPTGMPLEGWWYSTKLHPRFMHSAGARDIVWEQTGQGHRLLGCPEVVSESRNRRKEGKPELIPLLTGEQAAAIDYVGIDTQFFAAAVLPQPIAGDQPIKFLSAFAQPVQDVTVIPKTRLRTADVSFRLVTSPATIEPGSALTHDYRVFFGPKEPKVLAAYRLDDLIEYGWPIFKWPARLLQGVLWFLHSVTFNYGIAIILLTVIVRSCMLPISLKQARSAAKMQELAPQMQRIKDKFPDDPMKQHTEVQRLYKENNFNPFGGCVLVFFQLPIFIGLYRCLSVDLNLRDAALIPGLAWASNLAGPDKLFYWKDWMPAIIADEADGYLGPFFNVLPLITVSLFLVQQKLFTPPATDEQTQMQQTMMTWMTVFMGVMFYKVPAGLCLYFITSSLWGICERKLLPKAKPKSTSESSSGGGGLLAALSPKPAGTNGSSRPATRKPKQKR